MWWVIAGISTGVLYGIHNILIAEISENRGIMTPFYTASGIIFIYMLRFIFLSQEGVKSKFTPISILAPNCIGGILADVLTAETFRLAILDNMNLGIIVTIFSMCTLHTSLIFWWQHGEKLSFSHFSAIILMSISVMLLNMK